MKAVEVGRTVKDIVANMRSSVCSSRHSRRKLLVFNRSHSRDTYSAAPTTKKVAIQGNDNDANSKLHYNSVRISGV